jgi:hypothetical protein
MDIWVDALAIILAGSLALFAIAVNKRRPQTPGLILSALTLLVYLAYYGDRSVLTHTHARALLRPLSYLPGASSEFKSSAVPALILAGLYLFRVIVYQRVSIRKRLAHISDPIANFFAGATFAVVVGATIDSVFDWGWPGALILGFLFVLVYLGIFGMFEGLVEIVQELFGYEAVRLLRVLSSFATQVVKILSFLASLYKRLVPDLEQKAESLRARTEIERERYHEQVAQEDDLLAQVDMRNRSRRQRRSTR